ncbi:hypothetical protein [Sulfitobacter sp.]|uniref:hypothetical protein n=1 Tax=Sulfitobacter sp. TaxID=1903071 RepID=UPI0030025492
MQLIPVGDDFDVRSDVDQYSAAYQVIQLTGGRILALWTEYSWAGHSSGSGYVMDDVYARLYEANGTAVGSQFRVNASDLSIQAEPSATALDDGGFLVAWQTYTSGTSYLSQPIIVATRYDANGTAQTGEISVASAVGEGVESSELTNLGNGTVLLSYTEDQPYPAPSILKGVVLNAAGAPTGIPFEIGTAKFYSGAQSVAVLNNGNVMVSWSGVDSDSMGIYARVLSPTGVPVTGPILVNTDETSQQTYPETAVLADGSVIVVWQDGIVGDYNDVNARRVAADGSFLTDPFVVETIHTGGDQSRPDIIALSDGGFLIAWQTGDTWGEYDVVARRYDANGEPIDIETTLSSDAGGPEGFSPQLLELQDGRIAAFWEAFTWGGTSDMVMRLFEAQTFGTADPDVIVGGGTSNWIDGLAGDDTLSGMGGNDALFGGDGDDLLNGGAGNDLIDGGSGSDRVDYSTAWENLMVNISYAGAQRVSTGQGKDTFVSIEGILGGAGNDLLVGSAAADFIDGGAGNDEIYGIGAGDILNGGAGDDLIEGSGGNDTMNGGAGNDTLSYYHSAEGVYVNPILGTASGAGNDRFWGFENFYGSNIGDDFLVGNFNANRIIGFGGNDSIRGETGDDDLLGMQGNDTLLGGDGADTLTGGHGDDVLSGGAGKT